MHILEVVHVFQVKQVVLKVQNSYVLTLSQLSHALSQLFVSEGDDSDFVKSITVGQS